jgi:hypothetical protein
MHPTPWQRASPSYFFQFSWILAYLAFMVPRRGLPSKPEPVQHLVLNLILDILTAARPHPKGDGNDGAPMIPRRVSVKIATKARHSFLALCGRPNVEKASFSPLPSPFDFSIVLRATTAARTTSIATQHASIGRLTVRPCGRNTTAATGARI